MKQIDMDNCGDQYTVEEYLNGAYELIGYSFGHHNCTYVITKKGSNYVFEPSFVTLREYLFEGIVVELTDTVGDAFERYKIHNYLKGNHEIAQL